MRTSLFTAAAVAAALSACGDGPTDLATDPDGSPGRVPRVLASDADHATIGLLTGDDFVRGLLAGLDDRHARFRLDASLQDLSAAVEGGDRDALRQTLTAAISEADGPPAALEPDDQLAFEVFRIMFGHVEWLLAGERTAPDPEPTTEPIPHKEGVR